jgi:hypothetical protein
VLTEANLLDIPNMNSGAFSLTDSTCFPIDVTFTVYIGPTQMDRAFVSRQTSMSYIVEKKTYSTEPTNLDLLFPPYIYQTLG